MPVVTRSQTKAIREARKSYVELYIKRKNAFDQMINTTKILCQDKVTKSISIYQLYNYVLELSPIIDDALMHLQKFPTHPSYNFVGELYNTLIRFINQSKILNSESNISVRLKNDHGLVFSKVIQFICDFAKKVYNHLNETTSLQFYGDSIHSIAVNNLIIYPTA